jgi:NAD(P)-dependent dehydrogenase (short-subunit alcohol dehydrogenase family)
MTLFVTGGTSSIGRVLIKELARDGTSMRVLVRPNSNRDGLNQELGWQSHTFAEVIAKTWKDDQTQNWDPT